MSSRPIVARIFASRALRGTADGLVSVILADHLLRIGRTTRWTDPDAVKIIRRMAGQWSDRDIALTLNRLGLR